MPRISSALYIFSGRLQVQVFWIFFFHIISPCAFVFRFSTIESSVLSYCDYTINPETSSFSLVAFHIFWKTSGLSPIWVQVSPDFIFIFQNNYAVCFCLYGNYTINPETSRFFPAGLPDFFEDFQTVFNPCPFVFWVSQNNNLFHHIGDYTTSSFYFSGLYGNYTIGGGGGIYEMYRKSEIKLVEINLKEKSLEMGVDLGAVWWFGRLFQHFSFKNCKNV